MERSFGVTGQFPSFPGSDAANFDILREQLANTVFITNRAALKGGGSITDFEGTKAEQAELRIGNAQSVEAFKEAMEDYKYWIKRGYDNMKRAAKGDFSIEGETPAGPQEGATATNPQTGQKVIFTNGQWQPAP